MQKQVYNCETGQIALVDMTEAEIAVLATPVVPDSCTRTQCLLALLASGMSDPAGTITAAINAVTDAPTRTALMIRFKADTWHRTDLLAEGALIEMTPDQIDALLIAAQAY